RGVRQFRIPAGLGKGLLGGRDRELGEPVGPAGLLAAEEIERVEVTAGGDPVLDPGGAFAPAVEQGRAAHPERCDGTRSSDDDPLAHADFATTRSITSPTVCRFWTSSPTSSTPNSSSTICAISTRSSESTSSDSKVASRLMSAGSAP